MSEFCLGMIQNVVVGGINVADCAKLMNCRCINVSLSVLLLVLLKAIVSCSMYRFLLVRYVLRLFVLASYVLATERQTYLQEMVLSEATLKAGFQLVILYLVRYFLLQSYIRDKQKVDRCVVKKEDVEAKTAGVPEPIVLMQRHQRQSERSKPREPQSRRSALDFSFDLNRFLERNRDSCRYEGNEPAEGDRLFCCPGESAADQVELDEYRQLESAGFLELSCKCLLEYAYYILKCLVINFTLQEDDAEEALISTPACDVFCLRYGNVAYCLKVFLVADCLLYLILNYYMLRANTTITLRPITTEYAKIWLKCAYQILSRTLGKCLRNFCAPKSKIPFDIALAMSLKAADSYRNNPSRSRMGNGEDFWNGGVKRKSVGSREKSGDERETGGDDPKENID